MIGLLEDPEEACRLGEAARARVEAGFLTERMAGSLRALLEDVVAGA